ncbi:hypothetical protein U9M48_033166 [Paspalum notatum var. saurae]|uniref:Uncharacterized protein n=1 Tax=Paspalum notatum var. saurae TaxID=547442 RepID=A0AAQ3UAQ7_PASNO
MQLLCETFFLSCPSPRLLPPLRCKPATVPLWDDSAALLADLNALQAPPPPRRARQPPHPCHAANELLRMLLDAISASASLPAADGGGWSWKREPAGELAIGAAGQAFAALGHACVHAQDDLEQYMAYAPGGECPADEPLACALLLGGCEPLPWRWWYAHSAPLPGSLWGTPRDTSLEWDVHGKCQNHSCLLRTGAADWWDTCLDLRPGGRERAWWARDDDALSYSLDAVLAAQPNGTVRRRSRSGGATVGDGGDGMALRLEAVEDDEKERGYVVIGGAASSRTLAMRMRPARDKSNLLVCMETNEA